MALLNGGIAVVIPFRELNCTLDNHHSLQCSKFAYLPVHRKVDPCLPNRFPARKRKLSPLRMLPPVRGVGSKVSRVAFTVGVSTLLAPFVLIVFGIVPGGVRSFRCWVKGFAVSHIMQVPGCSTAGSFSSCSAFCHFRCVYRKAFRQHAQSAQGNSKSVAPISLSWHVSCDPMIPR